jgi:hypothetical protein
MAEEEKPPMTPTDALIKALEHADDMEHVLILYSDEREGRSRQGCFDNDLTVSEALFMIEIYKNWLLNHVTKEA